MRTAQLAIERQDLIRAHAFLPGHWRGIGCGACARAAQRGHPSRIPNLPGEDRWDSPALRAGKPGPLALRTCTSVCILYVRSAPASHFRFRPVILPRPTRSIPSPECRVQKTNRAQPNTRAISSHGVSVVRLSERDGQARSRGFSRRRQTLRSHLPHSSDHSPWHAAARTHARMHISSPSSPFREIDDATKAIGDPNRPRSESMDAEVSGCACPARIRNT